LAKDCPDKGTAKDKIYIARKIKAKKMAKRQ
jgi:hypothetical protein